MSENVRKNIVYTTKDENDWDNQNLEEMEETVSKKSEQICRNPMNFFCWEYVFQIFFVVGTILFFGVHRMMMIATHSDIHLLHKCF